MELECPSHLTPDPPADIPHPAASTPIAADAPPKPQRPSAHPSGISLPWTAPWPPPDLGRDLDPFDSPGIDFG